MMFQIDWPVSRDELVIQCALEELVELLSKLRIMMVRFCNKYFCDLLMFQTVQKTSCMVGSEL